MFIYPGARHSHIFIEQQSWFDLTDWLLNLAHHQVTNSANGDL